MAKDWEALGSAPPRWRTAVIGLGAVVVVGLLARPTPTAPDTSVLDVEQQDPVEAVPGGTPTPDRTPTITRRTPAPTPTPSPEASLPGEWVDVAPPPAALPPGAATVWDGEHRLFVTGGQTWNAQGTQSQFHDETWVYDVEQDSWTQLPPPPLEPRTLSAAAWTGTELIVWGGLGRTRTYSDGAAYDAGRGTWRRLPDSPLSPRQGASAVWTGEFVVVAGGADNAGGHADTALYYPGADRWATGPDLPVASPLYGQPARGVVHDGEPIVAFSEQYGPEAIAPLRLSGSAWQETRLPEAPERTMVWSPVDVPGHGVIALHAGWGNVGLVGGVVRLAPGSSTWEPLAEAPLTEEPMFGAAAVAGRYYVLVTGTGAVEAFDLEGGRWLTASRLPGTRYHHRGMAVVPLDDGLLAVAHVESTVGEIRPAAWRFVMGADASPAQRRE